MKDSVLEDYVSDVSLLKDKLKHTTGRSLKLLQGFIDEQNSITLNQAWSALELITSVLEEIQDRLVKVNL